MASQEIVIIFIDTKKPFTGKVNGDFFNEVVLVLTLTINGFTIEV